SATFTIVDYPSYFTPNADGYNDTWNIKGSRALDAAIIKIFDRYGKLIKQIDPNSEGWNGTFNNNLLPSTDYWFTIEYLKDNVKKEFKGHFSLIR
ncbi:MAG: T9SS type B sorting domain-containing protein, partial [Flavobacterium sp.]|nr:T9SS type B sorting domain-containing protein [Flavobacterium sp.]